MYNVRRDSVRLYKCHDAAWVASAKRLGRRRDFHFFWQSHNLLYDGARRSEDTPMLRRINTVTFSCRSTSLLYTMDGISGSSEAIAPRELTFGEKAAGLTFNPGGTSEVNTIKRLSADLIDELDRQRAKAKEENNGEKIAQFTLAIRDIQSGRMWGVNAATWQY